MKRHHGDFEITVNRLGSQWHWTVEIGRSGAIWTQGVARTQAAAWRAAESAAERGHSEFVLRGGRPRRRGRSRLRSPVAAPLSKNEKIALGTLAVIGGIVVIKVVT